VRSLKFLSAVFIAAPAFAYLPGHFYTFAHTHDKVIALTFDDGPGKTTPELLDILKQHNIHATFFMEGTQVERYPKIVREVAGDGHEIGNHTYWHFNYHKVKNATPERLVHELDQTESALKRALRDPKFHTNVVRMPYGYFNHSWLLPTLKEHGYALVHWTFDKENIPQRTPEEMADDYIKHARPGAIFLFHDGGPRRDKTLTAIVEVIEGLEQQGYHFVPAAELLKN
jgi:peptidoglycan-N-acetylglucosamine deacetylase